MRKICLPLLLLVPVFFSCSRHLNVNVGAGVSKVAGGSYTDPPGGQANVEAKLVELNKNSSVSAGLGFSYQGAHYSEGNGLTGTVRLGYVNLPLIYTYLAASGAYFEAGLQPGINVIAKDKYNGITEDFKYGTNTFELGLPLGGGYRFSNGVGVGLRAIYGITNLDKTGEESNHNILAVILLSYRFNGFSKK